MSYLLLTAECRNAQSAVTAKTQGSASLTSFIAFCDGVKVNALLESVRQPKCAGWRPLCMLA